MTTQDFRRIALAHELLAPARPATAAPDRDQDRDPTSILPPQTTPSATHLAATHLAATHLAATHLAADTACMV